MKPLSKKCMAATVFAAFGAISSAQAGTTYVFTVTCASSAQVVEWGVGDIDPGKEFLRVSTGTHYPDCSITDYDERDAGLPRVRYSHEEAIIKGIPLLGPLLEGIFG